MNEIEKQILKNQWAIMKSLFNQDSESDEELIEQLDKTNKLLSPKSNPTQAEKTEFAFPEESEVKDGN